MIVRFVILEKDIGSYVPGRRHYVDRKSTEENTVLKSIASAFQTAGFELNVLDLHQGIKSLWDEGLIDSPRAKFKKAFSTAQEAMDEELRIKEHAPDLYELIMDLPLFNTIFDVVGMQGVTLETFTVDPSKGYIAFPQYTKNAVDTDNVVRKILENN